MQEMQETRVRSLGWEDPLEKDMVAHSNILAWRIPWQRRLVGYSPWGHKELDTTERTRMHSVQFSSVAQSCPTLCDPIDGSPPGSPVPGFLQARILEWVAISFSNV